MSIFDTWLAWKITAVRRILIILLSWPLWHTVRIRMLLITSSCRMQLMFFSNFNLVLGCWPTLALIILSWGMLLITSSHRMQVMFFSNFNLVLGCWPTLALAPSIIMSWRMLLITSSHRMQLIFFSNFNLALGCCLTLALPPLIILFYLDLYLSAIYFTKYLEDTPLPTYLISDSVSWCGGASGGRRGKGDRCRISLIRLAEVVMLVGNNTIGTFSVRSSKFDF